MKRKIQVVGLLLLLVFTIVTISSAVYSEDEIKAYRNIDFGITRGELIRRVDMDDKTNSSGHMVGWENRNDWSEFDWIYEYASREIWVYIGEAKYVLIGNFYGNEKDPNGGTGKSGFVPGKLMRLWFMSPLENYANIDLVVDRRDYLVQVISNKYGDPGKREEVEPIALGENETKYSHVWYSEQTETEKQIKIGIESSPSGNFYLTIMAIEQPELVAKREQAECEKESEEAEEESQDF